MMQVTKIFVLGFISINDAIAHPLKDSPLLDHSQHHVTRKTSHYPKYPCNLCIDEDSIVGLPGKDIGQGYTCGSMQLESLEIDSNDDVCQLVQGYAKDCHCHGTREEGSTSDDKMPLTEDDDNTSSIDIRTRDYDGGFRKNENSNTDEANTKTPLLSHMFTTILSYIFLFFIVFALSSKIPIRQQLHRKHAVSTGLLMQFVIIPFAGFLMVLLLKDTDAGFTKAMGLTLLVVASSPGGSYSNWWCSLFNADVPLSVVTTFVSTLISLGMLPFNLIIYSTITYGGSNNGAEDDVEQQVVHYSAILITLGLIMTALLTGLYASYVMENKTFTKMADSLALMSSKGLIFLFFLLSSVGTTTHFWNQDGKIYIGIFFLNLVAVFLTNVYSQYFSKLEKPECVTLSIDCCYKNTAIAMSTALVMFPDPEEKAQALAIAIIYTVTQKLTMVIYCLLAWKVGWTNAPADRDLWTILINSYEANTYKYGKYNFDDHMGGTKSLKDVEDEVINLHGDDADDKKKPVDQNSQSQCLSLLEHQPPKGEDDQEYNEIRGDKGDTTNFHSMLKNKGFVPTASAWTHGPSNIENHASKWTIGNLFIIPNLSRSQIVVNSPNNDDYSRSQIVVSSPTNDDSMESVFPDLLTSAMVASSPFDDPASMCGYPSPMKSILPDPSTSAMVVRSPDDPESLMGRASPTVEGVNPFTKEESRDPPGFICKTYSEDKEVV